MINIWKGVIHLQIYLDLLISIQYRKLRDEQTQLMSR